MILIILFIVIPILVIAISHIADKYETAAATSILLGGIGTTIISLSMLISYLTVDKTIADYNALKTLVEYQRTEDLSQFERIQIYKDIHDLNKLLNNHKVFHNSLWLGPWYYKEIADLEYIK